MGFYKRMRSLGARPYKALLAFRSERPRCFTMDFRPTVSTRCDPAAVGGRGNLIDFLKPVSVYQALLKINHSHNHVRNVDFPYSHTSISSCTSDVVCKYLWYPIYGSSWQGNVLTAAEWLPRSPLQQQDFKGILSVPVYFIIRNLDVFDESLQSVVDYIFYSASTPSDSDRARSHICKSSWIPPPVVGNALTKRDLVRFTSLC